MFKRVIRYFIIGAGLWILQSGIAISGQTEQPDDKQSGKGAIALFESGKTREALIGFRELEQGDPGYVHRDYYIGICLVKLGEDLDEAIERLYRAAAGQDAPSDAAFYLARAYHLDYNFQEALKYYRQFELSASRQEEKEYGSDQLKATCRSAMEILSSYNPYEVMNVTFIDLSDSVQFSQIKMPGGQLQYKPAFLVSEEEERDGLISLMFLSPNSARGTYAYYSGYRKNGKEGAQLFRIRKGPGNAWGDPEEVKELNTGGDELLPYFDPIEDDLYFATNGRMGVGGYDLYRSHYDRERDEWSDPMNMGFPINSVMDEFLLLPGTDLGMMMFFSNRQGPDSMLTVYRVHLIEPRRKADVDDPAMLKEIAGMGGLADEILEELQALKQETADENPPGPRATEVIAPVTTPEPTPYSLAGDDIYEEALNHQAMADSLRRLAVEATIRVRESDDPNDRWVWQKQIMLWEKKSRDQEEMADELFAMLGARGTFQALAAGSVPETIRPDTVINGMIVYRYTGTPSLEGEPGTPPMRVGRGVGNEKGFNSFEILNQSPDHATAPVPMDILIPSGTFYRIQLGVFSTEVEYAVFKGITPITGEHMEGRGMVKYYAGKFSKYRDASSALARVQSRGFEDAFIVAWYNGKQVTTQRAKQLE
jgi:tetratricopeptide (TPR) repeat protein